MTELKAEYLAGVPSIAHACPSCGRVMGYETLDPCGHTYLLVGGLRVNYINAFCTCGNRIHWSSHETRLERIVRAPARIQAEANAKLDAAAEEIKKMT